MFFLLSILWMNPYVLSRCGIHSLKSSNLQNFECLLMLFLLSDLVDEQEEARWDNSNVEGWEEKR
jgi:hypothetical protein